MANLFLSFVLYKHMQLFCQNKTRFPACSPHPQFLLKIAEYEGFFSHDDMKEKRLYNTI